MFFDSTLLTSSVIINEREPGRENQGDGGERGGEREGEMEGERGRNHTSASFWQCSSSALR